MPVYTAVFRPYESGFGDGTARLRGNPIRAGRSVCGVSLIR
jgi:hypothetical protein